MEREMKMKELHGYMRIVYQLEVDLREMQAELETIKEVKWLSRMYEIAISEVEADLRIAMSNLHKMKIDMSIY